MCFSGQAHHKLLQVADGHLSLYVAGKAATVPLPGCWSEAVCWVQRCWFVAGKVVLSISIIYP